MTLVYVYIGNDFEKKYEKEIIYFVQYPYGLITQMPDKHLHKYAHHKDVIQWKLFPRCWLFVRGIPRWILLTKASDAELWPAPE